jgi:outer membrane receptor protein involved in Fe transport
MANKLLRNFSSFALAMTVMLPVAAQQETSIQTIEIKSKRNDLQGIADSASEGVVNQKQIANRPLMRTGDLLEVVPGLVSLQHAGEGHANQYFLRGFSLDHGTDFATYVDGVLINMPSHGHGQGYTDINFLIPELIESIRFRKGPYSAEDGDFASAGSARFRTVRSLDGPLGVLQIGSFGYKRVMAAVSQKLDQKDFLIAVQPRLNPMPSLWRATENRSSDPAAPSDREDPESPWVRGATAAPRASARTDVVLKHQAQKDKSTTQTFSPNILAVRAAARIANWSRLTGILSGNFAFAMPVCR